MQKAYQALASFITNSAMILDGSFASTGDEELSEPDSTSGRTFCSMPVFMSWSRRTCRQAARRLGAGGSSKYERRTVLDQYLLFHYGQNQDALPAGMAARDIGHFPQRCAQPLVDMSAKHGNGNARVIDVGCSVGGASFNLLNWFGEVTGVDILTQFIEAALSLRKGGSLPYWVVDEGDIGRVLLAHATVPADSSSVPTGRCVLAAG